MERPEPVTMPRVGALPTRASTRVGSDDTDSQELVKELRAYAASVEAETALVRLEGAELRRRLAKIKGEFNAALRRLLFDAGQDSSPRDGSQSLR